MRILIHTITLIGAFFSAVLSGFFFACYLVGDHEEPSFKYRSYGTLFKHETKHKYGITKKSEYTKERFPEKYALQKEMLARLDVVDIYHSNNRGDDYTIELDQSSNNSQNERRVFIYQTTIIAPKLSWAIYFIVPSIVYAFCAFI